MTDPLPANPSAITGFGCISPLGAGVDKQVRAIADDAVGLGPYRAMEQAGEVAEEGLRGGECAELGQPRVHERAARGLAQAAAEALHDAGVATDAPPYPPERIGAVLGTSLHGMNAAGAWLRGEPASTFGWFQGGHVLAHALQSLPVGGPRVTCSSACASALSSVAHARTWLESGLVDLVLCGGYDPVSEYTVAGFHALRVVSLDRLRPFAEDRQGMQVSEGYAVFVLERSADAAARGHVPRSLVTGMGESSDAFHLTKPHPDGVGAAAVLRDALQDAARAPADIDLVVAHATGTRDNDAAEAQAVRAVFDADAPPVTALKSRVGHTLGAAGALEAGLAWACLAEGTLPATANVAAQDVGEPVDLVIGAGLAAETPTRHLASCSLGFGGSNAVMIQTAPSAVGVSASQHERATHRVGIAGVGVVLPTWSGAGFPPRDAVWQTGKVDLAKTPSDLPPGKTRRISPLSRFAAEAAALALADAGLTPDDLPGLHAEARSRPACLVASTNGSASYALDYYREIVDDGYRAANPLLFAEGVPNAAAAHVSMLHKLHGPSQSIIGTHTSGLDALALAQMRIATGRWTTAVVCLAEEDHPLVREIAAGCGHVTHDAPPHEGAVAVVLRRIEHGVQASAELTAPAHRSTPDPATGLSDLYTDDGPAPACCATDRRQDVALRRAGRDVLPHGPWFGLGAGLALLHTLTAPDSEPRRLASGCPTGLVSSLVVSS